MTIGETVTLESLERDPYPIYARLRDEEPVNFVPAVGLWLVTRHDDVKRVTNDPETFTAATEPSSSTARWARTCSAWRAPSSGGSGRSRTCPSAPATSRNARRA
jgi:cytochrome P450